MVGVLGLAKIKFEVFFEPDDGVGYTALCTYPQEERIKQLNKLKLL